MKGAEDLVELARTFGRIVERIAERDAVDDTDWVDQSKSPLGARLHCAAVRRRRTEGKPGAEIHGRRHLLTRAALQEEMMTSPKPGLRKTTGAGPGRATTTAATLAKLRGLRGRQKEK